MGLILLNLQSNHEIYLDKNNPFVIGRGNLTGCADKRVSRSHGEITCTLDGKVSLRALHSNPCFFTRNGIPPVRQLNKNEEEVLSEGDCLGLLPNSYWYQITSTSKVKDKKLNNLELTSSEWVLSKPKISPKVEIIDLDRNDQQPPTPKSSPSKYIKNDTPGRDASQEKAVPSCSGESSNLKIPPELRNTCKLPLYMYEIKGQSNLQKTPIKGCIKNTMNKSPDLTKVKHSPGRASTPHGLDADLALNSTAASTDNVNNKSPDEKKGCQDNSNDVGNASKFKPGRPYCRYDSSCYRKNAQHKLEYSHPGDDDYIPYENRPLCEYGANCYRRNLTHRRQFRHVSTQDPQTSQALDPPVCTFVSTTPDATATADAAPAASASTAGASSNMSSGAHRERPKDRHKRKREKDRSSRSCHLSVTVSASPKQKRRRSNTTGDTSRSSFSSDFSYEDALFSSDPFSDDFSSDEYLPSDDSEDDFDDFEYHSRNHLRGSYY